MSVVPDLGIVRCVNVHYFCSHRLDSSKVCYVSVQWRTHRWRVETLKRVNILTW
jgi:hypothetical protein